MLFRGYRPGVTDPVGCMSDLVDSAIVSLFVFAMSTADGWVGWMWPCAGRHRWVSDRRAPFINRVTRTFRFVQRLGFLFLFLTKLTSR